MSKTLLRVNEIFGPTIQGEGTYAGYPVWFIRMAGCDNKCKFCDTKKAWHNALEMNELEIISKLDVRIANVVVITGGNPCIQDLAELIVELKERKFTVHIETQGTLAPKWLAQVDHVTISPKTPTSGNYTPIHSIRTIIDLLDYYGINTTIKTVVDQAEEEDWKYVKDMKFAGLLKGNIEFIIQPKDQVTEDFDTYGYANQYKELIEKYLSKVKEDAPIFGNIRVLPQLHKIAWGRKEGV